MANLKHLLNTDISHPEYYSDVLYKMRKIKGSDHFSDILSRKI